VLGVESHGILAFLNASCKYLGTLQDLCIGLREPKFRVSVLGVESYGIVAFRNASFKWSMPQSSTIFFSDDSPGPSPDSPAKKRGLSRRGQCAMFSTIVVGGVLGVKRGSAGSQEAVETCVCGGLVIDER
jgi:hypothetical protein